MPSRRRGGLASPGTAQEVQWRRTAGRPSRSGTTDRGVIAVGILLLVALVGIVAWVAGVATTTSCSRWSGPTSASPTTTAAPRRRCRWSAQHRAGDRPGQRPGNAPAHPRPDPGPDRGSRRPPRRRRRRDDRRRVDDAVRPGATIGELVPFVAAVAEPLTTPEAVQTQIDQLLAPPSRHRIRHATCRRCVLWCCSTHRSRSRGAGSATGRVAHLVDGRPDGAGIRGLRRQRR